MTDELIELVVGEPAHGGSCVARTADGQVVFVRHALPGERVRARITARRSTLLHAEAVEVLTPAPDRVPAPCPVAGPGGCGGCDLQHATPAAQRAWKASVVRSQLRRIAGVDVQLAVEALPDVDPAAPGLHWRTRARFAVAADGTAGLHQYRSRRLMALSDCPLVHPRLAAAGVLGRRWPGAAAVEVAVGESGPPRVVVHRRRGGTRVQGPRALPEQAAGRAVAVHGFWQVHPAAAPALVSALLDALALRPGERALDLYAGAGLFSLALAAAGAQVVAVEGDAVAARDAVRNVAGLPVEVWQGPVAEALADPALGEPDRVDVVVLDPPRAGAGPAVVAALAALRPRAVAYVACDPASLARDVAAFAGHGYRLRGVRAFDCFPMTHHVECVALLEPAAEGEG